MRSYRRIVSSSDYLDTDWLFCVRPLVPDKNTRKQAVAVETLPVWGGETVYQGTSQSRFHHSALISFEEYQPERLIGQYLRSFQIDPTV